eukprot:5676866-Alexandrium_andersonii.AAC.1
MSESPHEQAWTPPERLTGTPARSPPSGRWVLGDSALTQRFAAPFRAAPSCCVKAFSPTAWRPFGG